MNNMSLVATLLCIRRLTRSRVFKIVILLFSLIALFDALRIHQNIANGEAASRLSRQSRPQERIFITGMHFNNGALLKSHWNNALLRLTETFGAGNVFVSISESGSWDNTKEMLRELDIELGRKGVQRRIELSDETHQDEIDRGVRRGEAVETPEGLKVRRIPYLARLRNKTLKDLIDLNSKGVKFDKVLFLNDVVFTTDDVLTLLETNGGEYAAACSLDFKSPPVYYDTFALRDATGQPDVMQTWPYFRAGSSRNTLMKNMDAVPVSSCWNGIVVMPADPFVSSTQLRFRAIPDSLAAYHLEGSECCLIHADNPLSKTLGVYLNPRVRVGYSLPAYEKTHPGGSWVSTWDIFWGIWFNRIGGAFRGVIENSIIKRTVKNTVRRWERENMGNHEVGEFCIINEMQVLEHNGWAHI